MASPEINVHPIQNRYTEPLGNEPKLAQKGVYPYHHRYTASQGDKPAHKNVTYSYRH
jgi:hypothetical protein